jgi:hypothetical protein
MGFLVIDDLKKPPKMNSFGFQKTSDLNLRLDPGKLFFTTKSDRINPDPFSQHRTKLDFLLCFNYKL